MLDTLIFIFYGVNDIGFYYKFIVLPYILVMNFVETEVNKFLVWFDKMDDNPWFMAFMVVLGNIGLYYIRDDLDEKKEKIFKNVYVRRIILFSLIFCATKNFRVSILSTLAYSVMLIIL